MIIRVALEPHAWSYSCGFVGLKVRLSVCMDSFIECLLCGSHSSSISECLPCARCTTLGSESAKVNKKQSLPARGWWPGQDNGQQLQCWVVGARGKRSMNSV